MRPQTLVLPRRLSVLALGAIVWMGLFAAAGARAKDRPYFHVDQVRVGMRGYGLTVFQGTKVEAFPVKVLAVVKDAAAPDRSVVWISSSDPRLQRSGPVEGMSGSPIYLWGDGSKHKLGHGGKLLGAFAFGYGLSKGCLAGVQPIQYMRGVGARAQREPTGPKVARGGSDLGRRLIGRLSDVAASRGASAMQTYQMEGIQRLLRDASGDGARGGSGAAAGAGRTSAGRGGVRAALPPALSDGPGDQSVRPLMVPLSIGSPALASVFAPVLKPMGLSPVAGGPMAGAPPSYIDPDTPLTAGSTLAIPFAFGDMEIAAGGTATEVLDDGTVLAFGHPMDGIGRTAVPMASGYVHFVVPRLTTSFKRIGTLKVRGTVVRDESVGIAGVRGQSYKTAPVSVHVSTPVQKDHTYHFRIVDHPRLAPVVLSALVVRSITADQGLPTRNTVRVKGTMTFTGGRRLHFSDLMPQADPASIVYAIMPPIAAMMQNPHQRLMIRKADIDAHVVGKTRVATLVSAALDQPTARPGDPVGVTVSYQVYGDPAIHREHLKLKLPPGTAAGHYPLTISGASAYATRFAASHRYLAHTTNVDQLVDAVQRILNIDPGAIYATLQLPKPGVAVGRSAMKGLPTSQRAMLTAHTTTRTTSFPRMIVAQQSTGYAVAGKQSLVVDVIDPTKAKP